ncbi:helix-turn-helix domain-containing protein [Streptomyces sp. NPDC056982]|uniref:winged helix-turn-helix domain-containing protein n=1 Tax=Streptomyces sp. NPDC056982 TaxID=3345986 RepID=UPI0036368E03
MPVRSSSTEEPDGVTVHVRRVRTKLRDDGGSCCTIDAIRGMGYRLECSPAGTRAEPSRPA